MVKLLKLSVMTLGESIIFYSLIFLGVSFTALFGIWWFDLRHIPTNFQGSWHILDILLYILASFVVWYQIINELFSWYIATQMRQTPPLPPEKNKKVAFLTAFVPSKEPYEILENTLKSMVAVDYPHDTWVLDEGNDDTAKKICKKYKVKHFSRKDIVYYNQESGKYKEKTKGGNYNAWFDAHGEDYDYIAQIDVDFLPKRDFLTKTLGYFRDPDVAFVGTPQIYGNTSDSWIVKGAAEQAYNFYGHMQKGLNGHNMSLFIGANHIVRADAIRDINGYAGHIVEDHLTGMHFYSHKWKSVYVPEILAVGEGPSTWDAYFSQQMRWSYGLFHILFTQSPKVFPKMQVKHIFNYFILQLYYFYGPAQVAGVILLFLFFVFGISSAQMELQPLIDLYIPMLLIQFTLSIHLQRYNVDRKNESGILWRGRLLSMAAWPIYFLAFVSVLTGKRLTYKVTPKGAVQKQTTSLSIFMPHIILGTLSLFSFVYAFISGHYSPQLLFFAAFNTVIMYGFVLSVLAEKINEPIEVQPAASTRTENTVFKFEPNYSPLKYQPVTSNTIATSITQELNDQSIRLV